MARRKEAVPERTRLLCPQCRHVLVRTGHVAKCRSFHEYSVSRAGYITLFPPRRKPDEGREAHSGSMARQLLYGKGHWDKFEAALAEAAWQAHPSAQSVLEIGSMEGYFLPIVKERFEAGGVEIQAFGIDEARPGIEYAARRDRTIGWVLGPNDDPPFEAGTFDLALCLFQRPDYEKLARLLTPSGVLLQVVPEARHLRHMRTLLRKDPPAREAFLKGSSAWFKERSSERFTASSKLTKDERDWSVWFAPPAWDLDVKARSRIAAVDDVQFDIDVRFVVLDRL